MSDRESLDISKVVGLIMENPQLIEQISNLARQKSEPPTPEAAEVGSIAEAHEEAEEVSAQPTYQIPASNRGNRAQLLGALKPYVSSERAKAIDSMISIADILEMMRSR